MTRTRKILISLFALGALAAVGVGTYATFTAQTQNGGNSFATGTLLLSDKVLQATTCYSAGVSSGTILNNNSNTTGCTQVVNVTASTGEPGASGISSVVLQNTGTITPSTFTYQFSSCTPGNNGGTFGSGSLCSNTSGLNLMFQEFTPTGAIGISGSVPAGTFGTVNLSSPIGVVIPKGSPLLLVDTTALPNTNTQVVVLTTATLVGDTSLSFNSVTTTVPFTSGSVYLPKTGGCIYGATETVPSNNANVCTFDTGATTYAAGGPNSFKLGGIGTSAQSLGGLGPNVGRYFAVGVQLPDTGAGNDNNFQGLTAAWNLTWTLNQ